MIDLDHLSQQTGGDGGLQRQVLELFVAQIDIRLGELHSGGSASKLRELAHGIVGSARAVGAFELAGVADRIYSSGEISGSDITELMDVADRTQAFVATYLAQSTDSPLPNT